MENIKENEIDIQIEEQWKDIVGYERYYQISNMGRVKSLERQVPNNSGIQTVREKILSPCIAQNGYAVVNLTRNGKHKLCTIHRLLCIAWLDNPENKPEINHKNSIRSDNRLENLEFCTASENMKHAFEYGNLTVPYLFGETSNNCKLKESQVIEIRTLYNSEKISIRELAVKYGIHKDTIRQIIKRKTWRHLP